MTIRFILPGGVIEEVRFEEPTTEKINQEFEDRLIVMGDKFSLLQNLFVIEKVLVVVIDTTKGSVLN